MASRTRSAAAATNNNVADKADVVGDGSSKDDGERFDRRAMMVVFVALVVDLLAFTIILPLLPALLDYYGQNDSEVRSAEQGRNINRLDI